MSKLLFFILLTISPFTFGQALLDSITLLNGHTYMGRDTKIQGNFLTTTVHNAKGDYDMELALRRVFSMTNDQGENVYYYLDELQGDYLTIPESRQATWGSRDARVTSKPWGVFLSSAVISLSSSLFDTHLSQNKIDDLSAQSGVPSELEAGFFGAQPTMMQLLLPTTFSLVWAFPSFKVREHKILQANMRGNAFYYRGYNRIAKQKRMFSALLGGFVGTGVGLISYGIFKKN